MTSTCYYAVNGFVAGTGRLGVENSHRRLVRDGHVIMAKRPDNRRNRGSTFSPL